VNPATIRTFEEVSMNALPALQQVMLDGWVLRFGRGFTGRANSVYPLYPGFGSVDQKITTCERLYDYKSIPPLFKMTAAVEPEGLDQILEDRGYTAFNHTSVQTRELTTTQIPTVEDDADVEWWDHAADPWLDTFFLLRETPGKHHPTLRSLLANVVVPAHYVVIHKDGEKVACGMAVAQGEHVGLFDLTTHVHHRRQGIGTRLVDVLMNWGAARGTRLAYLQVMLANENALSLYHRLGFVESYQYWYRRRR
jgi:GNAT superfamily N-acetyltransferase